MLEPHGPHPPFDPTSGYTSPPTRTAKEWRRKANNALTENEAIFRDANERVERRLGELTFEGGRAPFLCECEDVACREILRLEPTEYEAVRAHPRHFVIAPDHPFVDGKIVERTDRFVVVEKVGDAGKIAEELDPRSPA